MGTLFKAPGILIYVMGGLWGLVLTMQIVYSALGGVATFLSLFVFPAVLYLAPWYAGLAHGDWFPLLVTYGSGVAAWILFVVGAAIDGR